MPVDIRFTAAAPTSTSGREARLGAARLRVSPLGAAARSSTSEFHASHPGHRPCHWADWKPHSEQL